MWNKIYIVVLFIFFFQISCKITLKQDIIEFIENQINFNTENYAIIIIAKDTDCSSCLWSYSDVKNSVDTSYFGLYLVTVEPKFKKVLQKINSNIEWKEFENEILYNQLQEYTNHHGPFIVKVKDGKIESIQ